MSIKPEVVPMTLSMIVLLCSLPVAPLGAATAVAGMRSDGTAASMPQAGETTVEDQVSETPVVLMSGEWARLSCEAWNQTPELTTGLLKWMENDEDRGYKVIQLYRTDCEESERVELRMSYQEEEARCIYGGWKETEELDSGADYVMHALTVRWEQMGNGDYGPMKGMMTRRLRFSGPMFEAMGNMGPFKSFLLLVGAVPSDSSVCPEGP